MSTRMDGIFQSSLFSHSTLRLDVHVPSGDRYRVLSEKLPWPKLAGVANLHRGKTIDLDNGRPLNLRLHLGALIAQSMNRWSDRETEEMVRLHAGVRFLCALEESVETIDRTSIEAFRNQLGKDGVEAVNRIIVGAAVKEGFTGTRLCASDTTVQEAPIAYPTEVGHMKNIAQKLVGIGSKIQKSVAGTLDGLAERVKEIFTDIRLFTRGKSLQAMERKKKLGLEMQTIVSKMRRIVQAEVDRLEPWAKGKFQARMEQYRLMLSQIRQWQKTKFHPTGKIISLWLTDARAIGRQKAGKMTEFGRRWIITRLEKGYIIGSVCKRLGSGSDTGLMPEILEHFERTMGQLPKKVVYDRGGDGPKNHQTLRDRGITNCIFRKGKVSQPGLGRNTALMARRERPLTEASIGTIKSQRYGFNKPRARSGEACILKGHAAILGANLAHLARDLGAVMA